MKAELANAFRDDITVTHVPAGLAVSTVFRRDDGDRIAFYVVEDEAGQLHLEDDGATIPMLEGAGVDFATETRSRALEALLGSVDATFDTADSTIRTRPFPRPELAAKALDFVAVMLRMNDFQLLTQEKVASVFREDAARALKARLGGTARIREDEPVSQRLAEVRPDMIAEAPDRPPVAIFFGHSDNRVHDAIFLHQAAAYEVHEPLSVIALLEQDNSVPSGLRNRAANRLAAVTVFRQDEEAAIARIAREVFGTG